MKEATGRLPTIDEGSLSLGWKRSPMGIPTFKLRRGHLPARSSWPSRSPRTSSVSSGRSRSRTFRCGRLRVVARHSIDHTRGSCSSWTSLHRWNAWRGMAGQHWRGTRLTEFLKWTAACHFRRSRFFEPDRSGGPKAVVSSRTFSQHEEVRRSEQFLQGGHKNSADGGPLDSATRW